MNGTVVDIPQRNRKPRSTSTAILQWCTDVVLSKIVINKLVDFAVSRLLCFVQALRLFNESIPCRNDLFLFKESKGKMHTENA